MESVYEMVLGTRKRRAAKGEKLMKAAKDCDSIAVLDHLKNGSDINYKDMHGYTPLMHAALYGTIDTVKLLLCMGADIHATTAFGHTALLDCVRSERIPIVTLLIQRGANLEAANSLGNRALSLSLYGSISMTALLLTYGADIEAKGKDGSTPLIEAVYTRDVEKIQLLIDNGANIEASDNLGRTPLILAAKLRLRRVSQLLIKMGAKVNALDDAGYSATKRALRKKDSDMIKLLLQHDAYVDPTNEHVLSYFLACVEKNRSTSVELLLKNKVNVDTRFKNNCTALHIAVTYGHAKMVKTLLSGKANVHAINDNGETPLKVLVKTWNLDLSNSDNHKTFKEKGDEKHFIAKSIATRLLNAGASKSGISKTENDSDINNLHDLLGVDQKELGSPVKAYKTDISTDSMHTPSKECKAEDEVEEETPGKVTRIGKRGDSFGIRVANRNAACNDAIEMLSVEEEKGRERGRERGSVPTWTSDALIRDTLLALQPTSQPSVLVGHSVISPLFSTFHSDINTKNPVYNLSVSTSKSNTFSYDDSAVPLRCSRSTTTVPMTSSTIPTPIPTSTSMNLSGVSNPAVFNSLHSQL